MQRDPLSAAQGGTVRIDPLSLLRPQGKDVKNVYSSVFVHILP